MRREQFDIILKEREKARAEALQKYVSSPSLQSIYPSPHSTMGSGALLMLAADRV